MNKFLILLGRTTELYAHWTPISMHCLPYPVRLVHP